MAAIAFMGRSSAIIACRGIEHSAERTRMSLALLGRIAAFQVGRRVASVSTNPLSCAAEGFFRHRGRPRYLHGNGPIMHPRIPSTRATSSSEHRMGMAEVFCIFTRRPDAMPYICKILVVVVSSRSTGLMKTITSSAKMDKRCSRPVRANGVRMPSSEANLKRRCSGSMIRMKSIGDNGPPWRSPQQLKIGAPGTPFTMMRVDDVERSPTIQDIHRAPKPMRCRTLRRKGHWTVSKAFEISNFTITAGCFKAWRRRAVHWASMKLSWRNRPLTKALWCWPTKCGSSLVSRQAKTLSKIFAAPCTRLTGR
ncbi:hypothetical protein ACQJBY_050752 [Aegilops geniculata]